MGQSAAVVAWRDSRARVRKQFRAKSDNRWLRTGDSTLRRHHHNCVLFRLSPTETWPGCSLQCPSCTMTWLDPAAEVSSPGEAEWFTTASESAGPQACLDYRSVKLRSEGESNPNLAWLEAIWTLMTHPACWISAWPGSTASSLPYRPLRQPLFLEVPGVPAGVLESAREGTELF